MKTVFTDNSTIAHLWANKAQYEAKNPSRNFYFDGDTIYSYGRHFPIAKHAVNENGERAVLFTERGYSPTTAKHISIVRQAANHLRIIYCHEINYLPSFNFDYWQREAENIARHLTTAKKPEKYLGQISDINKRAAIYAEFMGVDMPETLAAALSIGNKDEYKAYAEKKAALQIAAEKKRKQQEKAAHKKALTKWLKGEGHRLYTRGEYDFLRISGDIVETTQAVKIPLLEAGKLQLAIKAGKINVGDVVLNHYTVTEIGEEIAIGCHRFKTNYLAQFPLP